MPISIERGKLNESIKCKDFVVSQSIQPVIDFYSKIEAHLQSAMKLESYYECYHLSCALENISFESFRKIGVKKRISLKKDSRALCCTISGDTIDGKIFGDVVLRVDDNQLIFDDDVDFLKHNNEIELSPKVGDEVKASQVISGELSTYSGTVKAVYSHCSPTIEIPGFTLSHGWDWAYPPSLKYEGFLCEVSDYPKLERKLEGRGKLYFVNGKFSKDYDVVFKDGNLHNFDFKSGWACCSSVPYP